MLKEILIQSIFLKFPEIFLLQSIMWADVCFELVLYSSIIWFQLLSPFHLKNAFTDGWRSCMFFGIFQFSWFLAYGVLWWHFSLNLSCVLYLYLGLGVHIYYSYQYVNCMLKNFCCCVSPPPHFFWLFGDNLLMVWFWPYGYQTFQIRSLNERVDTVKFAGLLANFTETIHIYMTNRLCYPLKVAGTHDLFCGIFLRRRGFGTRIHASSHNNDRWRSKVFKTERNYQPTWGWCADV